MIAQPRDGYSQADRQGIIADYRRGVLLGEICKRWNLPHFRAIYGILGDEPRRTQKVTPEDREAILNAGRESVRAIAARFGYSKTTIHRIRTSGFDTAEIDEDADEIKIGYIETVWRCPEHGRVTVSPCPICAALGVIREQHDTKPASTTKSEKFETILDA
jgi:transposase-like protein